MGEARLRAEALARHQPLPQDLHRCPRCSSRRTVVEQAPAMWLSHVPTLMAICADCKTVWEAFPPGWKHDVVEGEPCDNCAFTKGSPESQDREEWRSMLAKLRMGQEFRCHKGAPLIIDLETGSVEFDEAWVQRYGRTCAGFLRAMQQWPDWLDNYMTVRHVLTKLDQDKLISHNDGAPAVASLNPRRIKAPAPIAERLVAASIIRDGVTESRGFKSHWQIRAALGDADPTKHSRGDCEGFVTSTGRFVTRDEAVAVGVTSCQLSPMWKSAGRELLSSDINW